jgi:DNA-binding MarR family transcriptional regulator
VPEYGPPRWDRSLREVGLVALQAAVLTRRIFLPATRRDDLTPEQWQLLLALALTDTASYEVSSPSLESLAVQLSLDQEYARELLYALRSAALVVTEIEPDDDTVRFRLSERGWAAARSYTQRAGRFLPGWPPPRPES